ncbi:MAG: thymidine phosphorylase [Syntrophomonas sp.]|nr:thymidine phosphorylase [Syntrophomonas sp.]
MKMQYIIERKRDGKELSRDEIEFLVRGIADGTIPDYQISAWAMAVYFQGMKQRETRDLALAMAYSGEVMDLSPVEGVKVDKHSTGGVGDKTTLVVIPLVAAAGVPVAKMSGRGLGHTGGTIDKFASIPGFKVEQDYQSFVNQVKEFKAAVVSQSDNLVPADKRLYAIRDVTATIDSIPLIASSVMSKKIASGAEGIVLDVKVGRGAFMKSYEKAHHLAQAMIDIGRGAGRQVVALLSNMDQPLGNAVGHALEVKEAMDTLKGQGPSDLEQLSLELAAQMIVLGEKAASIEEARDLARASLKSGLGWGRWQRIVAAQGGKLDYSRPSYGLPEAAIKEKITAGKRAYVERLDALEVGQAAMLLGAGRERLGDTIDHAVGIELFKKQGDLVEAGDTLALIHANDPVRLETARRVLLDAYHFSDKAAEKKPLIIETIS